MIQLPIDQYLKKHNVRLVAKTDLWWMRALGKVMFWNDKFMDSFWTTIILGPVRVIAYPSKFKSHEEALKRRYTLIHEMEHVLQADNALCRNKTLSNLWFSIQYTLLYFPVVVAYFRYNYEVQAYLRGFRAQVVNEGWTLSKEKLDAWVEWVATGLWKYYFYTVPPSVTRKRLKRELADLYEAAGR